MTDFSLVAPSSDETNGPQIDKDLQDRDRQIRAQALAGVTELSPERKNQDLLRTFKAAQQVDPHAQRIARRTAEAAGLPYETALEDPKFAMQVMQQRELEQRNMWKNHPTVARFMEDVEFAKIVSDDVDSLVKTDGFLNAYWVGRSIASGWQQQQQGDTWRAIMNNGGKADLAQQFKLDRLDGVLRRHEEEKGITGSLLNVIGQMAGTAVYSVPAALGGAATGSVVPGLGTAAGAAWGARAAIFGRSFYVERGNKYGELRKLGLSHDEAEKGSFGYALISAAAETVGFGFLTAPARGMLATRAASKMAEGLSKDLMQRAGIKFLKDAGTSAGGELGVEEFQTIASHFADLWAIQGSNLSAREKLETIEGMEELSTKMADTMIETLKGIGPLSLILPAVRLRYEAGLARQASKSTQLLADIVKTSGESKLAQEAPEAFARVLNEQAKKAGVETIYVDPETFEQAIADADKADLEARAKEAGVTVEEMAARVGDLGTGTRAMLNQKLPEVMNRLDELKDKGEQVEISTAKFVEVFRDTRLLMLLEKHIKFQRDGRTAAQAADFEAAKEQLQQQANKALNESTQKREELMRGAAELRAELSVQLKGIPVQKVEGEQATPMTAEDSNTAVEWVVNTAIVGATEDGISVGEWWAANKFTVLSGVSPEQARQQQSLQAAGRQPWMSPEFERVQEQVFDEQTGEATFRNYTSLQGLFDRLTDDRGYGSEFEAAAAEEVVKEMFGESRLNQLLGKSEALLVEAGITDKKLAEFEWRVNQRANQLMSENDMELQAAGRKAAADDATYLAAVERGDMKAAQEMVDAAAKAAGLDVVRVYHGTKKEFTSFNPAYRDASKLSYFSYDKEFARSYATGSGGHRTPEPAVVERIESVKESSKKFFEEQYSSLVAQYGSREKTPDDEVFALLEKARDYERSLLDGMTVSEAENEMGVRVLELYLDTGRVFNPRQQWSEFLPEILKYLQASSWESLRPDMQQHVKNGNYLIWEAPNVVDAVLEKYDSILLQESTVEQKLDTIAVRDPRRIKSADPVTRDASGNVIPLSQRFQFDSPDIRYAAERNEGGVQGAYFPRTRTIALYEAATITTFLHEASHWWMTTLFARARQPNAAPAVQSKLTAALNALGVDSLETWDALSNEEREARHEAFAYNFEDYMLQGRAPTEEQRGLFATIARWTRRLYSNLRDTLSATYQREFGQPLPMLSPELRQVFDRMTATEEQIEAAEMLRDLMPMFQTKDEALASGMSPEDWETFSKDVEAARESALERLTTASIDQMKNLAGAINDVLASKQRTMAIERNKTREEVAQELRVQKVYRIIRWLQTKVALDEQGQEFQPTLANKIAVKDVVRLIEAGALPDLKPPAAPKESVKADKAKLQEQEQRATDMRNRLAADQQRLNVLREQHKNLPRTPLEGLDQSGLLYQTRAELDAQREEIAKAEQAVQQSREALAKAEAEAEKNRKKSKKVRMAEGLTAEQWEAEQRELDAQLPDEVRKVETLDRSVQETREKLDSRGSKQLPKLKQKVDKLTTEVADAEAKLKTAQDAFRDKGYEVNSAAPDKKPAAVEELSKLAAVVKQAETKVNQKKSNLSKAKVDLEDGQKRPTYEGTERDRLQSNLRNYMAQRKTAEEKLRDARAKLRREAEAEANEKRKAAKDKLAKSESRLAKQQEKLAEIRSKLTQTERQKAATEVRKLHRFIQSEEARLRELDKRNELLAQRIELNEPTIQGPVLEKLGSMLTKQESGVALQAVAVLWGVDGGAAELLKMLYETPTLESAIESETDRRMLEKHGDYKSREDAEAVVADSMHEQARTKLVATELKWLQDQIRRIAEDLDPDIRRMREENDAALQAAEQQEAVLADNVTKARQIARQSPALQALEEQRSAAASAAQKASADVRAAAGPDKVKLQSVLDEKQNALRQILDQIDKSYGPDVDLAVSEWTKAKERVASLRKLSRKRVISTNVLIEAAAAVAEDAIGNTQVKDISSAKHQAEEGRQNRKAIDALATTRAKDKKGQPRLFKALEAKRLQLVHHMKAKVSRRAEKEIKKIEAAMRRAFKSPLENVNKNYNTELYTAARALAALFGFGPEVAVARAAEQLQATSKYHPDMWARIQNMLGPSVLQGQQTQDYRELTFSQLQDVHQLVKGLLELARAEKIVELNGRTVEVESARTKLTESLAKHKQSFAGMGTQAAASTWQKFLKFWDSTKAWLRGMEQWTVAIDGGRGPWWDLVYNPIKTGLNEYSVRRNKLVEQYAIWLKELDIDHDPVKSSEIGYTFHSMAEVLGAMMHVGNMSNYRKLLLGRGWAQEINGQLDDSKWKQFVDRLHSEGKLKKEHWDFLQKVWDMMEGLKPDLQKAHFQVFGFYFREVQYSPIETPFGSYRGGYVPAKTDPMLVASKQSEEDINQINGDMRAAVPSVQSNWRHERVEAYTQPLNLDLTMILRHLDETVRFIHVQPAVQNVLRIIRPFEERNSALGRVDQEAYAELIIPWMVSAARQVTSTRGSAFGHHVLDRLRRWTGMDAMFLGIGNAVGNFTALPMAMRKIGVGAVLSGLRQYVTGTAHGREGLQRLPNWVAQQSKFMDNRQRGKMLELAHMLDSLVNDPGAYRKVRRLAEKNAYWLQSVTQSVSDYAIWKGAYDKFKAMPEAQGLTEEQTHLKAVEFADYIVRDSSPSLSPEDQAKYLKQGPFMRLMVQYSGYFNWLANVNVTDFGNMIRELGWKTPMSLRFYQQLTLGYLAPLFLADAVMSILSGRFYDDEDDEELSSAIGRNVMVSVGRGTASMFPGVGQVAMALYGLGTEDPNDERVTNAPAIGYIMRAGRGALALTREAGEALGIVELEKEVSGREVRDIFGLMSLISGGIPTSWLGKPAQFLTDVADDKYGDPSGDVFLRGLASGKVEDASR